MLYRFVFKHLWLVSLILLMNGRPLHATMTADEVKSSFIEMGRAVIRYLTTNRDGREIVTFFALDVERLEATLAPNRIGVTTRLLRDRDRAVVDALSDLGEILLNHRAFESHAEERADVYHLVFHEMLQAAGYRDRDYPISGALRGFPIHLRVRRPPLQENSTALSYALREERLLQRGIRVARWCTERELEACAEDILTGVRLIRGRMSRPALTGRTLADWIYALDVYEQVLNRVERILDRAE